MMKMNILPSIGKSLVVTALILSALPFVAATDPGQAIVNNGFRCHRGFIQNRIMKKLDLTEAQMQQFDAIKEKTMENTKPLRENLHAKMRDMVTYASQPGTDPETAKAKLKEVQALRSQMGEVILSSWFEMKSHLSDEQLNKLVKVEEEKFEQFRKHFEEDQEAG